MKDQNLYLKATSEVDDNKQDPALWAKALALHDGDEHKAKYEYIRYRVKALKPADVDSKDDKETSKKGLSDDDGKNKAIDREKDEDKDKDKEESPETSSSPDKAKALSLTSTALTINGHEYMPTKEFAVKNELQEIEVIDRIKEGAYEGRLIESTWYINSSSGQRVEIVSTKTNKELGFTWWQVWAWLGLTIGNLYTFSLLQEIPEVAFLLVVVNSILMILVLNFNKYAFLIATIVSFNLLLWVINGIYLQKRWKHPKINNKKTS